MHQVNRASVYLTLISALFLTTTVLNLATIGGARPNLMLICVVFYALFFDDSIGFEAGLVSGLLVDMLSLDYFGINTLILGSVGALASYLRKKISRDSRVNQFFIMIACAAFAMTVHFFLITVLLMRGGINFAECFATTILPTSLYTALVAIPVFTKLFELYGLRRADDYL